jgi:integrase
LLVTAPPLVKPPRAPSARVQPWTGGQVSAVREALPARYRVLVDLGAGLGLRQGEAFGLAVDDVDFLHRVVHVRRQVRIVGRQMAFSPPKGGEERDVPLPESVALRLSAYIAAFPPAGVTLPWKVPEGRPVTARLLVITPQGRAVHRSAFNISRWQAALAAAGIPAARENGQHALRHYYASAPAGARGGHQGAERIPRPPRSGFHPPHLRAPDARRGRPDTAGRRCGFHQL